MAASVVGTSQYIAPEVIRGTAYDGRCDWWSIGIILYEVGIDDLNCNGLSELLTQISACTDSRLLCAKIKKKSRLGSW